VKWEPDVRRGQWFGAGIIALLVLIDAGLVWRVVGGSPNGVTFICALLVLLSLPAIALIAYRIYDLSHLRYEFDRNQLAIITAGTRQIVPTCNIEQVLVGADVALEVRVSSLTWPGCYIGQGHIEGVGTTLFYSVTPPQEQAIVVTPSLAYGLWVHDIEGFMEVLTTCQEIGPSMEVQQETKESHYVRWDIWRDRLAQGVLAGGVLLNLAVFGLLLFQYPTLDNLLPLHYDAAGAVDRISPRKDVFVLPVVGLIILAVNGAFGALMYRRERIASYMAWSGAAFVQILFLLALWSIVAQ
jgi:hypothetical protein